ncbi:hypothetical protein [Pseudolysinimonas sp.]|jgi:hypothetical protein|uniref:hypothetical protein n=1 Tax=Pseudolysinimonas sp. TaxID=2680009 RepID=UPI003783E406
MSETVFYAVTLSVLAGLALIPLWLKPKLLIGVAIVVILFVRTLAHLSGFAALSNADDGLVALVVVRAVFELRPHRVRPSYPGMIFFLLFLVCGVAGSLLSPFFSPSILLSGAFLAIKGVLLGWAVAQFPWTPDDIRRAYRFGGGLVVVVLVATVLNAAAPGAWASVFAVQGETIDRYGLPSLSGPFIHPFDLAFFSAMAAVAIYAYRHVIGPSRFTSVLLVGTTLATFFSFRRKDLLGLLAALFSLATLTRRMRGVVAAVLVLPILVVIAWDEISAQVDQVVGSYLTVDSGEARTVLTLNAFELANHYAPLGAGFGRYASRTAATTYSPEYFRLGLENSYGLGPGLRGFFLTDTSWPAIIGETGYLGTLMFLLAFVAIVLRARQWTLGEEPMLRMIGFTALGWTILTVFQSTGAAVFTSPPMFGLLFSILGLGAALERRPEAVPRPANRKVMRHVA